MDIEIKDKKVFASIKDQILEATEWGDKQCGYKPAIPAGRKLFKPQERPLLSRYDVPMPFVLLSRMCYVFVRAETDLI